MGLIKSMAKKAARSKKMYFIEHIRVGWNNYSFIFYIGGISAILGELFGIAGWFSTLLTVAFFYYAGKFKKELEIEREKIGKKKEKK